MSRLFFLFGLCVSTASYCVLNGKLGHIMTKDGQVILFSVSSIFLMLFLLIASWAHLRKFDGCGPGNDLEIVKEFAEDIEKLEELLGIELTMTSDCFSLTCKSDNLLNDLAFEFISCPYEMKSQSRTEFAEAFEGLKIFGLTANNWDPYMDYATNKYFCWFYEI